jgi:hypothetical protein
MRSALINATSKIVENVIMADTSDPAPDGFLIVGITEDFVQIGTAWDGARFVDPGAGMTSAEPITGLDMV